MTSTHDAHGEFQAGLIDGHGLVVAPLGPRNWSLAWLNLGALGVLVGEGLAVRIPEMEDSTSPLMPASLAFTSVGVHHPLVGENGEEEEERHHREDHQRQLPADGEHDGKRADKGDGGDEEVLLRPWWPAP